MSASESNGSAKTSGQDTHAHKKTSLCYLITQILTYIHKAIILKNNKTLPQTDMKTTVISYPVYRKELWCWFTLYSCLFLQILAFLGVPQLPQALHETMREFLYPPTDSPILLPSAWQLCYHSTPSNSSSTGDTLSLLPLKKLSFSHQPFLIFFFS